MTGGPGADRRDEHLLVDAKKLAAERRISLTRVVEDSLRAYLSEQRMKAPDPAVPLPVLTRFILVDGVDLDDTSRLLEIE